MSINSCLSQNTVQTQSFAVPGFSGKVSGRWLVAGDSQHGVPLGGLGTGFLEIKPGGLIGEAALQPGGPAIPVPHFQLSLTTRTGGKSLLVGDELTGSKPVSSKYFGHYPAADIEYGSIGPMNVSIRAMGQFVPTREDLSNIPSATFRIRLKNTSNRPVRVTLQLEVDTLFARLLQPELGGTQANSERISASSGKGIQWRMTGSSSTITVLGGGSGWSVETDFNRSATISLSHLLSAGEESIPTIVVAWHRPTLPTTIGRRLNHYAARFADSASVAAFAFNHVVELDHANCVWQGAIYNSGKPAWLSDALINSLYLIARNTVWTEIEGLNMVQGVSNSVDRPDWRYYGGVPLLVLFPNLEKDSILKESQSTTTDAANGGTVAKGLWRVISACRAILSTQDVELAGKLAPWLKKTLDKIGHYAGNDNPLLRDAADTEVMEGWKWQGAASYTNGLYISALKASGEVGVMLKDEGLNEFAKAKLQRLEAAFDEEFWANGVYRLYSDIDQFKQNDNSFVDQFAGLLDADQLGLGSLTPANHHRTGLKKLSELHANQVRFGAITSVTMSGQPDDTGAAATQEVSPSFVYHYAATALYSIQGSLDDPLREVVLRMAEGVWRGMQTSGSVWSQPSIFAAATGKPITGKDDLRNLAIWSIPLAMDGATLLGRAVR